MLEKLFMSVIEISLWLSVVIILLKITSPFIKKAYAAKWRYIIWLIIAVRLAIPFDITLPSAPVKLTVPDNTIALIQASDTVNSVSVIKITAFIWLFGIAVFALYQFMIYGSYKQKIKRWSMPLADIETVALFNRICAELNIKKIPDIKINKIAGSPMMFGFIKPVLYLQNVEYKDRESLEVILKHELVHYKRRDLWYKLLLLAANAVHWFNPLVYVMMRAANDDVEFSCDDEVIKNTDAAFKKKYSEIILDSVRTEKGKIRALTTQFKSGKKAMKNRFINILIPGKKRRGTVTLLLLALTILITSMLVSFTYEITSELDNYNNYIDNIIPSENENYKDNDSVTDEKLIAAQIDGKWTILEIP